MIKITIPWQWKFGMLLICCSLIIYSIKLITIDNLKGTIEYIFNSFGFLFINVLMVTLFINELLSIRAKKQRLEKMNMVIGLFYTESGTRLLSLLISWDRNRGELEKVMNINIHSAPPVQVMQKAIHDHTFSLNPRETGLFELNKFLYQHRDFLLRILENPVLLEHQQFTGLMQATFHLTEKLSRREDLVNIGDADLKHLTGDCIRVLTLLSIEWISYIVHLERNYPYLYSLAVRTSPFNPLAKAAVNSY